MWVLSFTALTCAVGNCDVNNSHGKNQQPVEVLNNWAESLEYVGLAVEEKGYHVWGSSPIIGPEGKTHLFVARWPVSKTFRAWCTHSEIAHYVADKPEGPFKFSEVVLQGTNQDTWDKKAPHNPAIHKVGDQYVLLYIANDGKMVGYPKDSRIGMTVSKSLYGPWKKVGKDGLVLSHPTDPQVWNYQDWSKVRRKFTTNPVFLQHPDGRFFIYYKGQGKKGITYGVAISDKLEGPYIHEEKSLTSNRSHIEDGYAFYAEGKFCLITTNNKAGEGFLWQSEDGIHFQEPTMGFDTMDKYIANEIIEAGTNYRGKKFERPQVLMQDGRPTYLYAPSGVNINKGDGSASYVLKINPKRARKTESSQKFRK
jgi:hypothetical protein